MDTTRLLGTATLAFGLILSGCDSTSTGLDLENGATDRQAQVLLSSSSSPAVSAALLSLAAQGNSGKPGKNGPIDLSTIDEIRVQITGVSALLADGGSAEDDDLDLESESASWVDFDLEYDPTTAFNLIDLGIVELATAPLGVDGELEAIRFYFGDTSVVFDDGAEEDLFIPSGKVTIPAAGLAVTLDDDVVVRFASGASVKKIIRTGRGLLMPPVFDVGNRGDDDFDDDFDEGEDADDAGDDDLDDDSGDDEDAGDDGHAGDGAEGGNGDDDDAGDGDDAEGGEAGDDDGDAAEGGDDAGSDDDGDDVSESDDGDDDSDTGDEDGSVEDDDEEETLEEE